MLSLAISLHPFFGHVFCIVFGHILFTETTADCIYDIFQQMAALAWVKDGNKEPYTFVTAARVGYELYNRVSSSSEVDVYEVSHNHNYREVFYLVETLVKDKGHILCALL